MFNLIGKDVLFNGRVHFSRPGAVTIGSNVHIGDNFFANSEGGIFIGDNTHISRNVTVYTSNHVMHGSRLPYDASKDYRTVYIGKNVWIGMNVSICPGSYIGDGAVIAMGSVVAGTVERCAVVASQSLRRIKQLDEQRYSLLDQSRSFGGIDGRPYQSKELTLDDLQRASFAPTFVVSTGRAGSTTIAKILDHHPLIDAYHEPRVELIELAAKYDKRAIGEPALRDRLTAIYSAASVYSNSVYVESDQKLVPFISILASIFPKSKFIWLVRRAEHFVPSSVSRGWFHDDEIKAADVGHQRHGVYTAYRPSAPDYGKISKLEWLQMSQFERNCWYWAFWNERISVALGDLHEDRKMLVKLEELEDQIDDIQRFVGVESSALPILHTNFPRERNYRVPDHWGDGERGSFERHCKNLMDSLYG